MARSSLVAIVLLMMVTALPVARADWPQWLGPRRDGSSEDIVSPWKGPLRIRWRVPAGEGHSSPIVANGKVFLHARVAGADAEEVLAFEAESGKLCWQQQYPRAPFSNQFGTGPRATPLFNQGRLYTIGVTGLLTCWQAASGQKLWQKDLLKDYHAPNLFFGFSSSPLVVGNLLLVMVGGPEASLIALDKATGKQVWQTGKDRASYSSPILVQHGRQELVVLLTAAGLLAVKPEDGTQVWFTPLRDLLNESATTPIKVGDCLLASSVTFGMLAARMTEVAGQPGVERKWHNPRLTCYFGTPVAVGDWVFVVTGRVTPPQADLHCVNPATGEIRWTKAKVGSYHATLLRVRDRLLMLEENGHLVLIQPDATQYVELARERICGPSWAHPALSRGVLYVRDQKELLAVELPTAP